MISIIVAIGNNNVIGKSGAGLLWKLPADLRHFKDATMGHPIIMGRKTFESIGRPLPGRTNVIITRQPDFQADGVIISSSLDAAIKNIFIDNSNQEVFIIGGGEIYAQALSLADRLYVTEVHHDFPEGDVYFPKIEGDAWREVSHIKGVKDEKNIYDYDFIIFDRI